MRKMFQTSRVIFPACLLAMVLCTPAASIAASAGLTRFTLPNGLEVIIQEDHARKAAAIQFWVMVGSTDEVDGERGISHLIEHMAFKGTQRRGVGKIAEEVAALGGSTNAYTSWDRTVFHLTVPSDAVLQGLDILADAVLNPAIDPDELKKEKQVVLEEILEQEDRPSSKAWELLFKTAYTRSPYRYPIIGFKDQVERLTRDDILAFRKKWYLPQNMFLLIVGDVDPVKLRPEIERMTAGLKPSVFIRPEKPTEPVQQSVRSALIRDPKAKETRLLMAFHIPSAKGADINALDITASILGRRKSSRLVRVLQKEKRLVNSIETNALTRRDLGLFLIVATLKGKNLEAATKEIMEELNRLRKEPPTADELQRAKIDIESDFVYGRETVEGTARSVGYFQADFGDVALEENYLLANKAVTQDRVSEVATKYLVPSNATVAVLLPEKEAPDFGINRLAAIIESYSPVASKAAAKKASAETTKRELPNGIQVVLKPDRSNPVISVKVACLGGKRFETVQTQGIMNFIRKTLAKGTGTLSEKQINKAIEDMGGTVFGFSGYDTFGIDARFFSRYLEDGLKLLADIYANPSFPEDVIERERKLIINDIESDPDRPMPFAFKKLAEVLFVKHPYGFDQKGTPDTVSRFTGKDLSETYKRFAVTSNTVITLVGDFDPDKAFAVIARLFGKIPAGTLVPPEVPREEPLTEVREKTIKMPREKAYILIGFRGTSIKDQDRYPLVVLSNVLSGMGGRLFRELRDKESLAYAVASIFRPHVDPGTFLFYIACDPSKADRAMKGLLREINRIRETEVTPDELNRSTKSVVGNYWIDLQSSSAQAESIALNTLYGLGPHYNPEYVEKISAVTAQQVLNVARKYLDPKRCAILKIIPEEKSEGK